MVHRRQPELSSWFHDANDEVPSGSVMLSQLTAKRLQIFVIVE